MPPLPPRCSDRIVKRGCDKLGIPCIPGRAAILTQTHNKRAACHYCAQCTQGCYTASRFSSSQVLIPDALKTGRLKIVPFAMAREVLVSKDGKATGVSYIDKTTRTERQVKARAVVLGVSACESARLLLTSQSSLFPNGLANSSGVVGRYLMDTTAHLVMGEAPELARVPPHNHDGTGSVHIYMPFWKYDKKRDYEGGFHVEIFGGPLMPHVGAFRGVAEGYGADLKAACKQRYPTFLQLHGRGEMIPNPESFCEVDRHTVDQWGIPVLQFHLKWSANELAMAHDMKTSFEQIIEAGGGRPLPSEPDPDFGYVAAGGVAHEVGTVRMGLDKKTSVLNGFCQAHDVKNLFVTDAGSFTSNPDKNPTLSITALSWRASEYLMDQAKQGAI